MKWKAQAKRTAPENLIFSTRSGKPISPNNILRRFVFPACESLGLPRATWLTFRRTYSSWAHARGVPDKVLSGLMGHSKVYTTLNVYTQVMDDSLRAAADAPHSTIEIRQSRIELAPQVGPLSLPNDDFRFSSSWILLTRRYIGNDLWCLFQIHPPA